jgi:tRNA U34 2-thiouridine synthase MnmA/TrmU
MKALVMFSWWLDSILAVKILEKQWIDCTAIIWCQ